MVLGQFKITQGVEKKSQLIKQLNLKTQYNFQADNLSIHVIELRHENKSQFKITTWRRKNYAHKPIMAGMFLYIC
jgi:hypothetical protein